MRYISVMQKLDAWFELYPVLGVAVELALWFAGALVLRFILKALLSWRATAIAKVVARGVTEEHVRALAGSLATLLAAVAFSATQTYLRLSPEAGKVAELVAKVAAYWQQLFLPIGCATPAPIFLHFKPPKREPNSTTNLCRLRVALPKWVC